MAPLPASLLTDWRFALLRCCLHKTWDRLAQKYVYLPRILSEYTEQSILCGFFWINQLLLYTKLGDFNTEILVQRINACLCILIKLNMRHS